MPPRCTAALSQIPPHSPSRDQHGARLAIARRQRPPLPRKERRQDTSRTRRPRLAGPEHLTEVECDLLLRDRAFVLARLTATDDAVELRARLADAVDAGGRIVPGPATAAAGGRLPGRLERRCG